jgi:hypothetical protein
MTILLILAAIAYLVAGVVSWLVAVLMFQGSPTGYVASLRDFAHKNTVAELAVAVGIVALWPLHLIGVAVSK